MIPLVQNIPSIYIDHRGEVADPALENNLSFAVRHARLGPWAGYSLLSPLPGEVNFGRHFFHWLESKVTVKSFSCGSMYTEAGFDFPVSCTGSAARMRHIDLCDPGRTL